MKLTNNIDFKNFKVTKNINNVKNIKKLLLNNINSKNEIINSLKKSYKYSFDKKKLYNLKKYSTIALIGMGGSLLGAKAIYSFLKKKISKNFLFLDNFDFLKKIIYKKKKINLVISKSGNTLETIVNTNLLLKKKDKNIFITGSKHSYLRTLALNIKADIIDHNNYIGGRYSVLSEVGMLPAELMNLDSSKFKQYDSLIKNKKFVDNLILNVSNTLTLVSKNKFNSIILNYDESSNDLFYWYQQLIAESLGKNSKGILPIISNLPKDNHSLMQYYLDGPKNNFYTFFFVNDEKGLKLNSNKLLKTHWYLKNKKTNHIKLAQYQATQQVFNDRKIPYRSFFIKKKNEQTIGELFTFFILETILLGKAMKLNPYNQPDVEYIKKNTKKKLVKFKLANNYF